MRLHLRCWLGLQSSEGLARVGGPASKAISMTGKLVLVTGGKSQFFSK